MVANATAVATCGAQRGVPSRVGHVSAITGSAAEPRRQSHWLALMKILLSEAGATRAARRYSNAWIREASAEGESARRADPHCRDLRVALCPRIVFHGRPAVLTVEC